MLLSDVESFGQALNENQFVHAQKRDLKGQRTRASNFSFLFLHVQKSSAEHYDAQSVKEAVKSSTLHKIES